MQRLRTVTSLDVSAVAGHHAMPAALLLRQGQSCFLVLLYGKMLKHKITMYEYKILWKLMKILSSKTTGPVVTRFHIEPKGLMGMKLCSGGSSPLTNMAVMHIYIVKP